MNPLAGPPGLGAGGVPRGRTGPPPVASARGPGLAPPPPRQAPNRRLGGATPAVAGVGPRPGRLTWARSVSPLPRRGASPRPPTALSCPEIAKERLPKRPPPRQHRRVTGAQRQGGVDDDRATGVADRRLG